MKRRSYSHREITALEAMWREEGKKDAIQEATEKSMLILMAVLRNEFGFGEQRLLKLFTLADQYAETLDEHKEALNETETVLEKGAGVAINGFGH